MVRDGKSLNESNVLVDEQFVKNCETLVSVDWFCWLRTRDRKKEDSSLRKTRKELANECTVQVRRSLPTAVREKGESSKGGTCYNNNMVNRA